MGGSVEAGERKVQRKRIVLKKIKVKRKRSGIQKHDIVKRPATFMSSNISQTALSAGLPAFRYRTNSSDAPCTGNNRSVDRNGRPRDDDDSSLAFQYDDGQEEEEIPSDTLMAIRSLVQSDQGLHLPIANNGSVQVVLENQIYSVFDENHASNVNTELLDLIQYNKLRRIYCHDMSSAAFILTDHYARAVWDAHAHGSDDPNSTTTTRASGLSGEIVSWFLSGLPFWTKTTISESQLDDRWDKKHPSSILSKKDTNLKDAVHYLLTAQFLIRDSRQTLGSSGKEESYFLWLPQWGIVLKAWSEARRQLLTLLAQRKEMSKANVMQKNRHSQISTSFLLSELLSKEKIRIVERPFGSFIQLVKHDEK